MTVAMSRIICSEFQVGVISAYYTLSGVWRDEGEEEVVSLLLIVLVLEVALESCWVAFTW